MYLRVYIRQDTLTYDFFFFNDTATTEIYTLSLHDALPISNNCGKSDDEASLSFGRLATPHPAQRRDRKSTRLNSSHGYISYAVFCLKKKKNTRSPTPFTINYCVLYTIIIQLHSSYHAQISV